MSIPRIHATLPPELQGLYFVYLKSYLKKAGITGTPGPHWLRTKMYNKISTHSYTLMRSSCNLISTPLVMADR